MFYSLPTEEPTGQKRFIRTEDLADGIMEFNLIDYDPESNSDTGNDLDSMWNKYPFQISVAVYFTMTEVIENIRLYYTTKEMRDAGIAVMMADLWGIVAPEPKEAPKVEKKNAKDRRPVVREPLALGPVSSVN